MKLDKGNLRHWYYLGLSALNVLLAIIRRRLANGHSDNRSQNKLVILYGHKLSGNLLALYGTLRASHADAIDVYFLTMDPVYYRELTAKGEACLLATSSACITSLTIVDAVVSDHGLHAMSPMLLWTNIKFIDVWHSIPFKGFDGDDFRVQHRYDEVWVASESQRELWISKYGFRREIVHATGYARTDCLVTQDRNVEEIVQNIGIDPATCGKVILFAPTWQQDSRNRSLFPFGLEADEFLRALSNLAISLDATVLLRTHINSGLSQQAVPFERVIHVPYARYPDTEAILLACDVLICDWSSIAFDYLLLDRPTFFLDVEMPFRKGFSLGPEYRFGEIVSGLEELIVGLRVGLVQPERYWQKNESRHAEIKRAVYGNYADGRASERCAERLLALVDRNARR